MENAFTLDVGSSWSSKKPMTCPVPAMPPLTDESFASVIARAQSGVREAIEALYVDMQPRLLRFFALAAGADADDLAGDVWVSVTKDIRRFHGDLPGFRGWLFTIAHRRLADHQRRLRRRPQSSRAVVEGDAIAAGETEREAIESLSGRDAAALVARLLPADQAEVVLLRVLGDLDTASVARIVGHTETWVRVTQHRAMKKLSNAMADRILVTI